MLNEKKEMARVINNQFEESKYNFVPKINKNSERIVSEKSKYLTIQNQTIEVDNMLSPKNPKNL